MLKTACKRAKLRHRVHPSVPAQSQQYLHVSAPRHLAGAVSPSNIWEYVPTQNTPKQLIIAQKLASLRAVLVRSNRPDPNRVWGCYVDLLNFLGFDKLPLEVHQAVLRKCTAPAAELRYAVAKRVPRRQGAHLYETRFQAIIRNIRAAGMTPTLDDYHFILEQFAAVGHHEGAMQVLEEITRTGLQKTPKTYGLCLQAMCHRLVLPHWNVTRPTMVLEVTRLCVKLIDEMQAHNVPFTSVNVDLAVRVLKETSDFEAFARLLKVAYGIDLSYPDRPPIELWDRDARKASSSASSGAPISFPDPLPFSTAALNTTIDGLGRLGEVSKLVQTFEVLTTRLPSRSSIPSSSFDDDEEDDFGISNPQVAPYRAPWARANTTTFHTLLKWISRAGHATFARHYVVQAIYFEKNVNSKLAVACKTRPPSKILAPSFAVNRSMLLSVYSMANRNKNLELMRWVHGKTNKVIRMKRWQLKYFTNIRDTWRRRSATVVNGSNAESSGEDVVPVLSDATTPADSENPESTSTTSAFSTFFSPSSATEEDASRTISTPPMSHFDVDLDSTSPSSPAPPKLFDIDLHITTLERDMDALRHFYDYVADVIGRTTQRVKERLGRRVWQGKNVYLRDRAQRVIVSRDDWRQRVNFKPTKVSLTKPKPPPVAQSNAPASSTAESQPTDNTSTIPTPEPGEGVEGSSTSRPV